MTKSENSNLTKVGMGKIHSNLSGATAVEFAIIAPFLLGLLCAAVDLGHYAYVRSITSGAMLKAGRDSSLETGSAANATIDGSVQSQVDLVVSGASYTFTRTNFADPSDIGKPERYSDTNGNNSRDPGECFDDYNRNGVWDVQGGASGQGGAKAYVVYKVVVSYPRIIPGMGYFGASPTHEVEAKTILANQPYTTADAVPTICT